MIEFKKPTNLNGSELRQELLAAGVQIGNEGREVVIDENGAFWLDIKEADKDKASAVVAAHNGTTSAPEQSVEEKLASVGLSVDDLKEALGL